MSSSKERGIYARVSVLNLSLRQSFEQWDLRLRATNLGDKRIAGRADYAFGSYLYFVDEGRGVLLEIKHYF